MLMDYRIPNVNNRRLKDPHVVILGAGASIAACKIDKNGRELPVLRNMHKILDLEGYLEGIDCIAGIDDFELIYSKLAELEEHRDLVRMLENEVAKYFRSLELPDKITVFDYLILSLTEKDIIISFNWDPLLLQAYRRNTIVGNLPKLAFPHGNAGVGLCYDCYNKGYYGDNCPDCNKKFNSMPLLFPVNKKRYFDGSIIESEWNLAEDYISRAAGITIFGYGAPSTDVEAVNLMRKSFDRSHIKEIAPVTIINLQNVRDEQLDRWNEFYSERGISYVNSFNETRLWEWPRVSLESYYDAILQQRPRKQDKSFYEFDSLYELQQFVKSINEFDMAMIGENI